MRAFEIFHILALTLFLSLVPNRPLQDSGGQQGT